MKKIILIIAVAALFCLGLQSCKTTNDCPAYGKNAEKAGVEKLA